VSRTENGILEPEDIETL